MWYASSAILNSVSMPNRDTNRFSPISFSVPYLRNHELQQHQLVRQCPSHPPPIGCQHCRLPTFPVLILKQNPPMHACCVVTLIYSSNTLPRSYNCFSPCPCLHMCADACPCIIWPCSAPNLPLIETLTVPPLSPPRCHIDMNTNCNTVSW